MPPIHKNTGTAHYRQVIKEQQDLISKLQSQLFNLSRDFTHVNVDIIKDAKYVYTSIERQKGFKVVLSEMKSILIKCENTNNSLFKMDKLKKRLKYLDTLTCYKNIKPAIS